MNAIAPNQDRLGSIFLPVDFNKRSLVVALSVLLDWITDTYEDFDTPHAYASHLLADGRHRHGDS
jgi:hypothetical protein